MNPSILVIDDSAAIRAVTKMAIAHLGVPVLEANSGEQALEVLRHNSVALILSDVNMPGVSGLELLKRIKAEPALQGIPFVLVTTEASREMMEQGRAGGAKGWITKPFRNDALVQTVQHFLGSQLVH